MRFNSLINNEPALRSLLGTVQTLTELQDHFSRVVPAPFAQATRILGLHNGTLSIATANGTMAAKLRQLAPELVTKLQNRGCEVSAIRVKVQVNYEARPPKRTARLLTETAQLQLQELGRNLSDGPLKQALEKLSKKKG